MKLDTNYLNKLKYKEVNLKDIDVEIVKTEDSDGKGSSLAIKGELELTETALKQFCSFLRIPYAFTKQLRTHGKSHVMPYLQRQLSRSSDGSVVLVMDNDYIVSITDGERLHYRGKEAVQFDTRLEQLVSSTDCPLQLTGRTFNNGDVLYSLLFRDSEKIDDDRDGQGLWRSGFILSHSAIGLSSPKIGVELLRLVSASTVWLPLKSHSYPMTFEKDFETRWNYVASFLQNPPPPIWTTLNKYVTKLAKTTASLREVKDARSKLMKLKIDRDDHETPKRIDESLQWKRINKAYDFKNMTDKPPKSWYSRASTPLSLLDVCNVVSKEATTAPNTLDFDLRQNLFLYAGGMLVATPDLFMQSTTIDWSKN